MKRLFASLSLAPLLLAPAEACADTLEDALTAAYRNNPNLEDARLAVPGSRLGDLEHAVARTELIRQCSERRAAYSSTEAGCQRSNDVCASEV